VIFDRKWECESECARVTHIDELRDIAGAASLSALSARCGVPVETIENVARSFALADTAACLARTGSSQGKHGGLTEYKLPPAPTRPSRVRGLVPVEGYYPLAQLTDEILTPGSGQIRALIFNAANPVICGPESNTLANALKELELLVSIDMFQRESRRHAYWLIPGLHFFERDEVNVMLADMNDEAYIGSIRAAVPPVFSRNFGDDVKVSARSQNSGRGRAVSCFRGDEAGIAPVHHIFVLVVLLVSGEMSDQKAQ